MKYVWKIIVRNSLNEPGGREGYALAGSMGEALELAGIPDAMAIPQTEKVWPVGEAQVIIWHNWYEALHV